jgi:hypothetical protein
VKKKDLYINAHLVVAAIRILGHKNGMPPAIGTLGSILTFSVEECSYICRRLHELDIIDIVEGPFGTKLFIKNHLALEDIHRSDDDPDIKEDIDKFMSSKKNYEKEIEAIKAKQKKKQKDLFAQIDRKLKKSLDPKST